MEERFRTSAKRWMWPLVSLMS